MQAAGPCLVTVGHPADIAGWRGCVSVDGLLRVRLWQLEVLGSLPSLTCVAVPTRLEHFRIVLTGADGCGGCGRSRTRSR